MKLDAYGTPQPKGSHRVITRGANGRLLPFPRVLDDNPKTKAWEKLVAGTALALCRGPGFADVALRVTVEFRLPRPASHFGARGLLPSAPRWPIVKPDLDKLLRSTMDALKGIAFDDDSRICEFTTRKRYAWGIEPTGAAITVEPIPDDQLTIPEVPCR